MASRRELAVASFERHLGRQQCTLWGRAFDLSDPDSRKAAAEWFIGEILEWGGEEDD